MHDEEQKNRPKNPYQATSQEKRLAARMGLPAFDWPRILSFALFAVRTSPDRRSNFVLVPGMIFCRLRLAARTGLEPVHRP
jgi:hypothetical protein